MAVDQGGLAISLAECKAYLRLERDDEDAVLAGLIRTATGLCEAFIGQWLLVRETEQRLVVGAGWQRLAVLPVTAVLGVSDGGVALVATAFEVDIEACGQGWVRLNGSGLAAPVVRYRAGMAADWNDIPEPLRQGMVRLVVHLFSHRDAADAGPPPAAVAAMWRPWRRMRLG
ncbi:head-tail connector protein [Polymorphobacter sp.]|uniref:head-tail connector protein n=1 Tax=Polymorphobacter sp. TaxID=1909290 RepID=UPI003F6FF4D4